MLKTVKGNPNKPYRVMIYGPEGVGKSTFGAMAEKPIFISPEDGVDLLKDRDGNAIEALEDMSTFDKIRYGIKQLLTEKHDYKTVVIDSADWLEKACHSKVIGTSGKDIIRAGGGYGAGYRESENLHRQLIEELTNLMQVRKMNVIITAHAHVRAAKDPDSDKDYDSFEIKCHEFVSSLWREWVQALFFVRFRTFIKESEMGKARAFGDDSRVAFTTKRPAFQAKNRFGMPHEFEFDMDFFSKFEKYAKLGETPQASMEELVSEVQELILLIEDEKTVDAVNGSMAKATTVAQVKQIRDRLKDITGNKAKGA